MEMSRSLKKYYGNPTLTVRVKRGGPVKDINLKYINSCVECE
jgi:hypothetical protein